VPIPYLTLSDGSTIRFGNPAELVITSLDEYINNVKTNGIEESNDVLIRLKDIIKATINGVIKLSVPIPDVSPGSGNNQG